MINAEHEEFKIIVVGDNNAGKTSLIRKIVTDKFISKNDVFDINLNKTMIHKKNNTQIKMNFIDINPDKNNQNINSKLCNNNNSNIYKGCNAVIIAFDLTLAENYRSIPFWIQNIKRNTNRLDFIILAGTKCDQSNRYATDAKITNLCQNYKNNNLIYIETSSVTGKNINELCDLLIDNIYDHKTNETSHKNNLQNNTIYNTFDNSSETIHFIRHDKKSKIRKFFNRMFPCLG
jgi:small GTP-binding protein